LQKVHDKVGDALLADRIAVKAKQIHEANLLKGSHRHRIQARILEGDVYCVIEVPLTFFRK
jgi:hypothetical protein